MQITPAQYESQLERLLRSVAKGRSLQINTPEEIAHVRAVVTTWFQACKPYALIQGLSDSNIAAVDEPLDQCLKLTFTRSKRKVYSRCLRAACRAFQQNILYPLSLQPPRGALTVTANEVYARLNKVAVSLAESYRQVHADLADKSRISFRGTAGELRETLRELLELLAPDEKVKAQSWYSAVEGRKDPTHQQRAKYVLEQRGSGSKPLEVANRAVSLIEDGLSKLVRDMYSRTSAAAHTGKDIEEVQRMLRHFDALVYDLCE